MNQTHGNFSILNPNARKTKPVPLSVVALVLDWPVRNLRSMASRGKIQTDQLGRNSLRFIELSEIARIAQEFAIAPTWEYITKSEPEGKK